MEDASLRNFRDFLMIYNKMAESCFHRCAEDFTSRDLTKHEAECVHRCAIKHINVNHRMMSVYMEVQPQIVAKRVEEMEKAQTELQAKQQITE